MLKDRINQRVPPSWYKLLCHKLCKSPFIVCCDLDIFIMPSAPPIHEVIQPDMINICKDGSNPNSNLIKRFPFFKYNCGLIGIPKTSQNFMENIYRKNAMTGKWPTWEQMYVNQALINKPINLLPKRWNYMVCFDKKAQFPRCNDWHFKHFTTCGMYGYKKRNMWAEEHFNFYTKIKVL